MLLWDSLLPFSHFFSANTRTHALSVFHLYSLSPPLSSTLYLLWFPSFISHLLFLIPRLRSSSTAMMTSFSVLRDVSLLTSLNGSLRWPRYRIQSLHCTACEGVFNMIISLTGPQVVDWISIFAKFYFFAIFAICKFLSISPAAFLMFFIPCLVSLFHVLVHTPFFSLGVFKTSLLAWQVCIVVVCECRQCLHSASHSIIQ